MRIVLFDWTPGGHHPLYVRRFVEALSPKSEVIVAAPDELHEQIGNIDAESISLGPGRPPMDSTRPLAPQHRQLAERELDLFEDIARRSAADHLVHLYADPVIRRLVSRPMLPTRVTLCVFFARAHYPASYDSPLAPRELLRAWFLESLVRRWQRRSDAHALLTLDEVAARRWSKHGRAFWLPEPPVVSIPAPAVERVGCLLYGTLASRKGLDLVARAVSLAPTSLQIVLAGEVDPSFREPLERDTERMRSAGADVELRLHRHTEDEGLRAIAAARCVLLPYLNHYTASRVLLEAATVGTPVIAHERGLVGHLVRLHGLGLSLDCSDPLALREAMLELAERQSPGRYLESLQRFAERYSDDRFRAAVSLPFPERSDFAGSSSYTQQGAHMIDREHTA